MENSDRTDISTFRRVASVRRTLAYGAIAGFIATWSISTAIAASEFELGIPISTFYAVVGITLGSDDPISAAYLGFGLHLATGTVLGGLIGVLAVSIERFRKSDMTNIFNPYRAVLMGIGTGVLVWIVLFLPITAVLIQPSQSRIAEVLSSQAATDSNLVRQAFSGIALSAIAFHVVWGAIFGFIISSLARIKLSMSLSETASEYGKYGHLSDRSLKLAFFGLAAGVISSLAISGLILLAEKVISVPVGTFYYILVAGVTDSYSADFTAAVSIGLVMHLLAGSFMGLLMSLPFMMVKAGSGTIGKGGSFVTRHSAAYGLAFGFGIWLLVFMPTSYLIVLPLLNSFENDDVFLAQRLPTGDASFATFFKLASIVDQVVYGSIAFNMLFGLLVAIIIQSFYEKYLVLGRPKKQMQSQNTPDAVSAS